MRKLTKEVNRVLSRIATEAAQPAYTAHKKRLVAEFDALLRIGRTEDEALEKLEQEAMGAIIAQRLALKR